MLSKKPKAPRAAWGQGKGGHKPSSTKKSNPTGLDPSNPYYGIKDTSKGFRTGPLGSTKNPASNQSQIARKAKRQVG